MAVIVNHGGPGHLLGLEPDPGPPRAEPDLDVQDVRTGQVRQHGRGPGDGGRRDLLVGHEQVAAGPADSAEQHAPAVRHDADPVCGPAAFHDELVHERRADHDVLAPHRLDGVVVRQLAGAQTGAVDDDIRDRAGLAEPGHNALLDPAAERLHPAGQPAQVARHVRERQLRREASGEPGWEPGLVQHLPEAGHPGDLRRQGGTELGRGQQPARHQPHARSRILRQLPEHAVGSLFPGQAALVAEPEHRAQHRPGHRRNRPRRRAGRPYHGLGAGLEQRHRTSQAAHPGAHYYDLHPPSAELRLAEG